MPRNPVISRYQVWNTLARTELCTKRQQTNLVLNFPGCCCLCPGDVTENLQQTSLTGDLLVGVPGLECSSLGKAWLNFHDSIFYITADCRQCSWRSCCHASALGTTPRPVGRSVWRPWLCSAFEIQSSAVWMMAFVLSLLAEKLLSLCRPVFALKRWVWWMI